MIRSTEGDHELYEREQAHDRHVAIELFWLLVTLLGIIAGVAIGFMFDPAVGAVCGCFMAAAGIDQYRKRVDKRKGGK